MSKTRGIFERNAIKYIRFADENGNIVRESTGQSNHEVAKDILNMRRSQVSLKIYLVVKTFEETHFRELLDYWWEYCGSRKRSKYNYLLPRFDRFRKVLARRITPEAIHGFMDELAAGGLSPSSVNHHRNIFSSVFSFCIKWKKYDQNPAAAVSLLPEPPGRNRFLTAKEIGRILATCDRLGYADLRAFIWQAGVTGCRKSELLPRRWDELVLDGQHPHIRIPTTKNDEPKFMPLPEEAIAALRQLPSYGSSEYLFPAKPNPKAPDPQKFSKPHAWDLGKKWRRVCRIAKVTDARIHDLRHFTASALFSNDVPDDRIRRVTGHRSKELDRYVHFSPEFKNQTVDVIARMLSDTATDTVPEESDGREELVGTSARKKES